MTRILATLIVGWGVGLTAPSFGATLFDNGGPSNQGGNAMTDLLQAEDFVLSSASDLTSIRFWNLEASPADFSGSIFWQIFSNVSGAPGSALFSGTATPTQTAAGTALGFNVFQDDFNIAVGGLAAGTYWLVLHNGPIGNTNFTDFYWDWTATGSGNNGMEQSLNPAVPGFTTNGAEHALAIFGNPVATGSPEPGAWVLVSSGFAALLFAGRKRKA